MNRPRESLPKVYFETHFQHAGDWHPAPRSFAIITAYATTGEDWPQERNLAADRRLEEQLDATGHWRRRLTGYSPTTRHAEPGWAVALAFEAACDLGKAFLQDAIYFVEDATLTVSFCDHRRGRVIVGPFQTRLHPP